MKNVLFLLFFCFLNLSVEAQFYSEDFENGIPDDWTAENAWTEGTANTLSSSSFSITDHGRFVGVNDDQLGASFDGSGKLIMPMLDLSTLDDSYAISFDAYFLNSDFQGKDETAKLLASTNGGQTWQELYDIEAAYEWQIINVGLGSLAGQSEVWFAFEYDDGNGWNYGVAIDEVRIRQIYQRNLGLETFSIPKYVPNVGDVFMDLNVLNLGIETVQSFDVVIDYDGNEYRSNINSFPIGFLETYEFQLLIPFAYDETELYKFDFRIENINGADDLDPSDNSGNLQFSTVANPPIKRTIAEEGTGTWCGWCPRGSVWLEYMKQNYEDDFVGIAVHNKDPMTLAEYDGALGISGFPGLKIDRKYTIDPGEVEQYHLENVKLVSPIGIDFDFDYNEVSRQLSVYPKATVHTRLSGDYRFGVILSEDEVVGSDGGYAQANYYSGSQDLIDVHGVNWRLLPDPVPADQMVYNEVGRALIGGFSGLFNSIGEELNNGDELSGSFDYSIPNTFNEQNLNIIVVAIDAESGEVLNGMEKELFMTSSVNEWPVELAEYSLSPNPASEFINLELNLSAKSDIQIEIYDQLGRMVSNQKIYNQNGLFVHQIDLNGYKEGMFLVKFFVNDNYLIEKLIVGQ